MLFWPSSFFFCNSRITFAFCKTFTVKFNFRGFAREESVGFFKERGICC
jgi:hypothetical protein